MQFFPAHVFLKVFLHDLQIPFAQIFPTTERASESMILVIKVTPSREMIAKTLHVLIWNILNYIEIDQESRTLAAMQTCFLKSLGFFLWVHQPKDA